MCEFLHDNPLPDFDPESGSLITIMAGVGATSAYATDIVAVQRVYYNQVRKCGSNRRRGIAESFTQIFNFSYQWFVVMSTQMIGFSIGGVAKRFLVSPPSMSQWSLKILFLDYSNNHFF